MKHTCFAALVLVAAFGCVSGRVDLGVNPPLARIASDLQPGRSTAADVARVLGEPDGKGEALLPIHDGPRTVWSYSYEYSEFSGAEVERSGRTLVWVYLDGEVYDGYLWYSSALDSHAAP